MNEKDDNRVPYFFTFVQTCESIRVTPSKNKKVDLISQYISYLNEDSLYLAVLFLSGKVFPRGSPYSLNVGFRTILQSLYDISNLHYSDIKRINLEQGDMGAIAEYAISKKQVVTLFNHLENKEEEEQLTLNDIYIQLKKIANLNGPRSNNDKKKSFKRITY